MGRRFWLILVLISGCSQLNVPLNKPEVPLEKRVLNSTRSSFTSNAGANNNGYFVGLALSGGGSRSANFSAACMFQLQKIGILDHVDYISAVSGGALTAAYYCTNDKDWNPGNVQKLMTHSFANDLIFTAIQPWNALVLWLTPWNRSDVLADSFQRNLYSHNGKGLTFADLRADRPRLLVNATDLQTGKKFVFCNETFDDLNSDLSKYPLAYAVAASSAVPVVMHHVTLRDYSTIFKQYRHLIDGGINDNLGVTSLVEAYTKQVQAAKDAHAPDPYPNGLILLVVDSHTNYDTDLSDKSDIGLLETLATGAGLSTSVLLNRVSSATLAELIVKYSPDNVTAQSLRQQIDELDRTGVLLTKDHDGKPVRVVHLSMTRVNELTDLPFASFGQRINSTSTYFNIESKQAAHLYQAAELLVRERFQPTLQEIAHELQHE